MAASSGPPQHHRYPAKQQLDVTRQHGVAWDASLRPWDIGDGVPTSTRTILFTDLANYTANVARSDREGLHRILREHQELVSPIVERYQGRIVKNLGDSYMCIFLAATDALRASLDIQELVGSTGGLSIRLALATGDVEEIDGDAFGEVVNLAARVLGKAPEGEIWFSAGTRACMIATEIPWESVGCFRLKGIPGEQEIYRAVPRSRCWLPEPVSSAAKTYNIVRIERGMPAPPLPPDPVVLFEGFHPGSPELAAAVDQLPVLEPARLWLAAYNISPTDRQVWSEMGRGLVVGTPEAIEAGFVDALRQVTRSSGSDTIVLDIGRTVDIEFMVVGLALPRVRAPAPLSDVVSSYFYELLPDGRWVSRSDKAILRVEVVGEGVRLTATSNNVVVDGRGLDSGNHFILEHNSRIKTSAGEFQFRSANRHYVGVIIGPPISGRLGVMRGQTAELGREPNHPGIAFPERRGRDNIRWCNGARAAKARSGGFTLDRALAGRRQATLTLVEESVQLQPLHTRCPTYVLDQEGELSRVNEQMNINVDDYVVAATTVIGMQYPEE